MSAYYFEQIPKFQPELIGKYWCLSRPPGYAQIPDNTTVEDLWFPAREIPNPDDIESIGARSAFGIIHNPAGMLQFETVWKWDLLPVHPLERVYYLAWLRADRNLDHGIRELQDQLEQGRGFLECNKLDDFSGFTSLALEFLDVVPEYEDMASSPY